MEKFINQMVSAIVKAVMREVLQPNTLRTIFDAWRQANEKRLVEVVKPNENDDELQAAIKDSGMGDVPLPTDRP